MATSLLRVFLTMTVSGSMMILVIMLARVLLQKAPKTLTTFLWLLVFIRLLLPFSFQTPVSALNLVPGLNKAEELLLDEKDSTLKPDNPASEGRIPGGTDTIPGENRQTLANDFFTPQHVILLIWTAGAVSFALYTLISFLQFRKKLQVSVALGQNIYEVDQLTTPFIYGVLQPKIFLPEGLSEKDRQYVLLHERTHIHYLDTVFKFIGFLALMFHWFNPFVWIAFYLFTNDLEMACDERVMRYLNEVNRADYAESIVNLSRRKNRIDYYPIAFLGADPKRRVKQITGSGKPSRIASAAVLIVMLLLTGCFMTDPMRSGTVPRFPLKVKGLQFGMSEEQCREILGEPVEISKATDNPDSETTTIYTYGDVDSLFGPCVFVRLYFEDQPIQYGDAGPFSLGLSRVVLSTKETDREVLYKKLNKVYGPLEGGETEFGKEIRKENSKAYQEYYWNKDTHYSKLSEDQQSILKTIIPDLAFETINRYRGLTQIEFGGVEESSCGIDIKAELGVILEKVKKRGE